MDLIRSLASSVGLQEDQAQALAGSLLGKIQSSVKDEAGDAPAQELSKAIPELGSWQQKAQQLVAPAAPAAPSAGGLLGGLLGGGGGGLLDSVANAVGGESLRETAAVVQILSRFNIDPSKAVMVAPLLLDFLKKRLSPQLLGVVLQAAPLLGSSDKNNDDKPDNKADDKPASPGLGDVLGGLGGLFGKS
jgi:hypothetical protein